MRVSGGLGELAYLEVDLLLAGARLTERYTPDLYHSRVSAGAIRPTAHLTPSQFNHNLAQEALLSHRV